METDISYTFTVVDNVSPVVDRISASQDNLSAKTNIAKQSIDSQNIAFLTQLGAVTAVYGGMNMVTRSMETLGLVGTDTAKSMQKVSAAVGIMAGSFNAIRGAAKLVSALKTQEIGLAAVETYRAVLNNPAKLAMVALAGGAAAAGVGYLAGRSSGGGGSGGGTTVNQNFSFSGGSSSDQRTVARDTLEIMGG